MTDREAAEMLYAWCAEDGDHVEYPPGHDWAGTCQEDGTEWPCPVEQVRQHLAMETSNG